MFFWGSYNFQAPQLAEHPNRPPLRFPVYMPPAPSMISSSTSSGGDDNEEKLHRIDERQVVVKSLACGQKHMVAVAAIAEHRAAPTATTSDDGASCGWAVYGMGSNHSGQLGHRVPEYTTTLTKLHFEELLSSGTGVRSLACGNKHSLLCTTSGTVFAAGDNSCDQLGVTAKVDGFAPVGGLAHVKAVYAAGNASFALDEKGQLYAWGEAQYGHLCHGDTGERMDARTLQTVKTNVAVPTLVQWFVRHHIVIVEVSVGRAHVVCRSSDEVYTCGEGFYGKLGNGSVAASLTPLRVSFPNRAHPEQLCGVAAGDDHTLVLRESPVVGAVVYHFGRMSNGDGQLTPIVVAAPASITRISAGRGTISLAVTREGRLCVWGKHGYARVSNGTPADAKRSNAVLVAALESFVVTDAAVGGTFIVAVAASQRTIGGVDGVEMQEQTPPVSSDNKDNHDENGASSSSSCARRWDIVVPQDERVGHRGTEGADESYEAAVHAFLTQYLGPALVSAYVARIPAAPPLTDHNANAFVPIGVHALTVGQKLRLWMTDVYALGTVAEVLPEANSSNEEHNASTRADANSTDNASTNGEAHKGCRIRIAWQRDDWHDEEITLHSDDETLDEHNPNRWQPLWFLRNPNKHDEYVLDR
ncbi:hypothetical protein DQ04_05221050 [Trypanosoma grayi]|uniref:hypothetical protein n=1 Tax=Trypanosoma grayi TaxID=71804 RepID=UPI0004F49390|nr:hypothetical protein DQ04_05221050 [Trypanosoma grayi]KEG09441.1 hypothetical protein DQ04_05221050 [Trypanosoma grayi]